MRWLWVLTIGDEVIINPHDWEGGGYGSSREGGGYGSSREGGGYGSSRVGMGWLIGSSRVGMRWLCVLTSRDEVVLGPHGWKEVVNWVITSGDEVVNWALT